jgi:hypothetical protein
MANSIDDNIDQILSLLAKRQKLPDASMRDGVSGEQLRIATSLSPNQVNVAVTLMKEAGLVEWYRTLGTAPFDFREVMLTPRGMYEYERRTQVPATAARVSDTATIIPPSPIGSPYGFSNEDWKSVSESKSKSEELRVVLGFQFTSTYYDSDTLAGNVKLMFEKAVDSYNAMPQSLVVALLFRPLAAGYGEHLFNEIARNIISADIAVFDTSDLNPNVMIEMGVALTWGIRVLPIKRHACPKPPSDISGQTWADYEESARHFIDLDHDRKMLRLVERAAREKGKKH